MSSKAADLEAALEAALDSNDSDTNSQDSQDGVVLNFKPLNRDPIKAVLTVVRDSDGDLGLDQITWVTVNKQNTVVPTICSDEGVHTEIPAAKVVERVRLHMKDAGKSNTDDDILQYTDDAYEHDGSMLFLTKKVVTYLKGSIKRKQKKEEDGVKKPEPEVVVDDVQTSKPPGKDDVQPRKPRKSVNPTKREYSDDDSEDDLEPNKRHKSGGVKPVDDDEGEPRVAKADPELEHELTKRADGEQEITLTLRLPLSFLSNVAKQ